MKERIVIEEPKFIEYFKHTDNDYYEHRVEQVPETFDEVQKLCERYRAKHEFEAHSNFTLIEEFSVRDDGSIWLHYENIAIQTELTPARQWQIIKSLIGE